MANDRAAELLERVPPHDTAAEMACLGSMMLDSRMANECLGIVVPEDFYSPHHRTIAAAVSALCAAGHPIDLVTMSDELQKRSELEQVGGEGYLMTLAESVPSAANGERYAAIVRDKALVRNFIYVAGDLMRDAYEPQVDPDEFLSTAERKLFSTTTRKQSGRPLPISDVMRQAFEEIQKAASGEGVGVKTGFIELDEMLTGLKPGEMIVLGARPSVGKTALALNIADYVAGADKRGVAIYSLEMRRNEIAARMLSAHARLDLQAFKRGVVSDADHEKLMAAAGEMAQMNIQIDDTSNQSIFDIRSKCRRLAMDMPIDLVIIDYLQLMQQPRRAENRQVEVSEISRAVKTLARELDCPVLALSQLNRQSEGAERMPRLSDLRESGALEQDADVVLLLHRPVVDDVARGQSTSEATVIVAKQRNGPTGSVKLQFQSQHTRFVNPTFHYGE